MPPDHTNSPLKCAPHNVKSYAHKPGPKPDKITSKDIPKTSTLSHVPPSQRNLTLHDWLHVVDWFNKNQPVTQEATVNHFTFVTSMISLVFNLRLTSSSQNLQAKIFICLRYYIQFP